MAPGKNLPSYILLCMVFLPMFMNAMPFKWLVKAPLPEFEDARETRSVDEVLNMLSAADNVKRALASSGCNDEECLGQYVWGKKRDLNNRFGNFQKDTTIAELQSKYAQAHKRLEIKSRATIRDDLFYRLTRNGFNFFLMQNISHSRSRRS